MSSSIKFHWIAIVAVIGVLNCNSTLLGQGKGKGKNGGGGGGNGGTATYSIIPFVPSGFDSGYANDLNEMGQAVGEANIAAGQPGQAVHFDIASGTYTLLESGAYPASTAFDVNDQNQIVGAMANGSSDTVGVFWSSPTAAPTLLPPLPGDAHSRATGLNHTGLVVGESMSSTFDVRRGVVWRVSVAVNGTVQVNAPVELPLPVGGIGSRIAAITEGYDGSAVVAGTTYYQDAVQEATIWMLSVNPDSTFFVAGVEGLGSLDGAFSEANGANIFGDVAGSSGSANGSTPVIAPLGQDFQPLATPRNATGANAQDVNDLGDIVGPVYFWKRQWALPRGFAYLWQDGEPTDLLQRVSNGSNWDRLSSAWAINNAGIIAGGGYLDGEGNGFLLIPNSN